MLFCAVMLPFVVAIILAFFGKYLGDKIGYVALAIPVAVFSYFLFQIHSVVKGAGAQVLFSWLPSFGINVSLTLTGLSCFFAILISFVGCLVFWYSIGYLNKNERLVNFYCFLLIFMGAMLGVVTSSNLMMTYLFWELTSFSSFLLIGFWYERERPRYGAQKALYLTVIGGFCLFAAFVLIQSVTGSFEIAEIRTAVSTLHESPLYPVIVILVLIGAFTKSAQVPFHIWLPDAMEAPTPISCYLHSATMVKAGIYLIALMTGILGGTVLWFAVISFVGLASLFWGAYRALKQTDMKAILANSTVSQLGLIIALLGYGSEAAIVAALFHLANHAAFKGSLFLVTGMIDHTTGTRDIRRLRGLASVMPVTAILAGCGTLAMAGLPPFNGFISKELFFESSLAAVNTNLSFLGGLAWIVPVLAVCGSIFTFVYCMTILFKVFFGGSVPKDLPHEPHEPEKLMLVPSAILASLTLILAFFPNVFAHYLLEPAVSAVTGSAVSIHLGLWHGFNWSLLMTLIVIGAGLLILIKIKPFHRFIERLPQIISMNKIYDRIIPQNGLTHAASRLTNSYMTGRLPDYIAFSCLFFVLIALGTIFFHGALSINANELSSISPFELTWALAIIAATITICNSHRRIPVIFALGVIGYSVSFFFVIFRAPDLALTQLLVETVSLVLFFLAFRYLPRSFKEKPITKKRKTVNLIISGLVGITVMLITMIGHSNKLFDSIASYYIENAKTLGGGNNIVNVILVDFRGLDTMGEISVIALASIGVYILISLTITKKPPVPSEKEVSSNDH